LSIFAYDNAQDRVLMLSSDAVKSYDRNSGALINASLVTGLNGYGALSPDGKQLVATRPGLVGSSSTRWLSVLDLASMAWTDFEVPITAPSAVLSAGFAGNHSLLIAESVANQFIPLRSLALETGNIVTIPGGEGYSDSPNRVLPGTNPSVVLLSAGPGLGFFDVGAMKYETLLGYSYWNDFAVNSSGSQFAVTEGGLVALYNQSSQRIGLLGDPSGPWGYAVQYSPVNDVLYVAWEPDVLTGAPGSITAYDGTTLNELADIDLPLDETATLLRLSGDGTRLFAYTNNNGFGATFKSHWLIYDVASLTPEPASRAMAISVLALVPRTRKRKSRLA
jgi:hypothetical protein